MRVWKLGRFWRGKGAGGKVLLFTNKLEALLYVNGFGTDQAAELHYLMCEKKINAIEKAIAKLEAKNADRN